jgi:hypothetical protein
MIVSGVLFLLLIATNLRGFKKREETETPVQAEGEGA